MDIFGKLLVMLQGICIKIILIGLDTRPGDGETKCFAAKILGTINIFKALVPEISGPAARFPPHLRLPEVADVSAIFIIGFALVIGGGNPEYEIEILGQRWW